MKLFLDTERDLTDRESTIKKMNHCNKFATFSSFDKTRAKLNPDSLINYPSPYASVQVNGSKSTPTTLEKRFIDNSLYATVKRTPRVPKSEHNIYDYPGSYEKRHKKRANRAQLLLNLILH
jgi:hypothetical protein